MTRNFSRRKFLTYFYLIFSIFVFVFYPLYGFYVENKYFSLEAFLTAPIFGNYRFTLSQLLLDVDSLIANFITILLFCLIFAFFAVYYGPTSIELGSRDSSPAIVKRMKFFGGIAAGILGVAILLSITQLGYIRPELAGRTFEIMFLNFHPENFSVQVYYYLFLFSGWPGILYLAGSTKTAVRRATWAGSKTNTGRIYLIIAVAIVEIMFFAFPLIQYVVTTSGVAIREVLFSLFDILFLTGVILFQEMKDTCKSCPPTESGIEMVQGKVEVLKTGTRYQKHAYGWAAASLALLVFFGVILGGGDFGLKISTAYFIGRVWGFGFTIFFTLFLIAWGRLRMMNHKNQEGVN